MSILKNFLAIVGAALGSSVLGGIFGAIVAAVSPEFVKGLASPSEAGSLVRYAASLGMIWGLFLGAAVMTLSLLIAALIRLTTALGSGKGTP
jgi:hypothetical protein